MEIPIMQVRSQVLCFCPCCLQKDWHQVVSIHLDDETEPGYDPDIVLQFRCSHCRKQFTQRYKLVSTGPVNSDDGYQIKDFLGKEGKRNDVK